MEIRNEKSEKARKAAEARWNKASNSKGSAKKNPEKSKRNADAMQPHSERNAIKEKKVKEIKEKDIKHVYAEFVQLTHEEHEKLVKEFGEQNTQKMIEVLDNYKGASGKNYKSDYRAILNWVKDRVINEKGGGQAAAIKSNNEELGQQYNFGF